MRKLILMFGLAACACAQVTITGTIRDARNVVWSGRIQPKAIAVTPSAYGPTVIAPIVVTNGVLSTTLNPGTYSVTYTDAVGRAFRTATWTVTGTGPVVFSDIESGASTSPIYPFAYTLIAGLSKGDLLVGGASGIARLAAPADGTYNLHWTAGVPTWSVGGSAAALDVGTAAGTVAAGDDARFSNVLRPDANGNVAIGNTLSAGRVLETGIAHTYGTVETYSRPVTPTGYNFASVPVNLVTSPNDLTASDWRYAQAAVVTAKDAATAPNGSAIGVSKLTFGTPSGGYIYERYNAGASIQGQTYTFSCWIWSAAKTTIRMRANGITTTADQITNDIAVTAMPRFFTATRTYTSTDTAILLGFDNRFGGADTGDLLVWGIRFDHAASAYPVVPPVDAYVAFAGDSLTIGGQGGAVAYPTALMGTTYAGLIPYQNWGVGGYTTLDLLAQWATINAATASTNKYLVVWVGTNDLLYARDPILVHDAVAKYCRTAQLAGWQVILLSVIARGAGEGQRLAFNSATAANWPEYANAYVDVGANVHFSTLAATLDTTYYAADRTHLTTAGYALIGSLVKAATDLVIHVVTP